MSERDAAQGARSAAIEAIKEIEIGEIASTAQRRDAPTQPFIQCFPS